MRVPAIQFVAGSGQAGVAEGFDLKVCVRARKEPDGDEAGDGQRKTSRQNPAESMEVSFWILLGGLHHGPDLSRGGMDLD